MPSAKYPLQVFNCLTCNRQYQRRVQLGRKSSPFCSRECWQCRPTTRITIHCEVCGTEKTYHVSRVKTGYGRYCSRRCAFIAFKGRPLPHNEQWELNRIKAVRKAAVTRIYPRGYSRQPEHIEPMRAGLALAKSANPELFRLRSIANLPPVRRGSLHPAWRGGLSKVRDEWRRANAVKIKHFRRAILQRDNYKCQQCGSDCRLEVHHVIPLAEDKSVAFVESNVITLCHDCHKKTDSYCGRQKRKAA